MNPLTNMRNVKKLSEQELKTQPKSSWHDEYRSSAWIFVGGLPYDLSEGDVMAIFSQYGEIVNLNLVRDKDTGKQKGFCFICYEDQRSTVLAVDNFNGIRVLGRILRVDHVKDYKPPKSSEPTRKIKTEKIDDDFKVKSEFKTEVQTEIKTEVKQEVFSPVIKREICTPDIKREICSPEIIRSPDSSSDKKKKNKKRHSRDKSKEKDTHYKHKRKRSKEKDRTKYYKKDIDKSYEEGNRHKRSRHSPSQEIGMNKDSKSKSYKEHRIRENSKERERKLFKDDRKEYQKRDYEKKYKHY